ncbi:MAG: PHP domain-containing protein [Acidobacteriia bacterium]|nr:PHP domain-containing protein [Terriglobia bacterium]
MRVGVEWRGMSPARLRRGWKRADLHVHTSFSGWGHLRLIGARDCYVTPDAAFEAARARGMHFVCFTDHNTIAGALDFLSRRPDEAHRVIVGEEVDTSIPGSSQRLHVGVLGVDERLHVDIARLRGNVFHLIAELRSRGVFFALNHPFRGSRSVRSARRDLASVLPLVPAIEVCNGSEPASHGRILKEMFASGNFGPKVLVGGSDAHRAQRVGTVHTAAPGRSTSEYLENLKRGICAVGGEPAGLRALLWDVYSIIGSYYGQLLGDLGSKRRRGRHLPGAVALVPAVLAGVPLILTAAQACHREWIARRGRWETLDGSPVGATVVPTPSPPAPRRGRPWRTSWRSRTSRTG